MVTPNSALTVYTPAERQLLKDTICKGASDNELSLFIAQCEHLRLDPFAKQIYAIKRKEKDRETGEWVERMGVQVSIDGLRIIADRTGKYLGQLGPYWCGKDGQWVDVWLSDEPPAAAKVGILREGFKEPIWGIAKYNEFVQRNRDGRPNAMWEKMPSNQDAKCAEAQGLKKAFPQELNKVEFADELKPAIERDENVIEGTVIRESAGNGQRQAPALPETAASNPGAIPTPSAKPEPVPAKTAAATSAPKRFTDPVMEAVLGGAPVRTAQDTPAVDVAVVRAKLDEWERRHGSEVAYPSDVFGRFRGLVVSKLEELLGGEEPRHILVDALYGSDAGTSKELTQAQLSALLDWMGLERRKEPGKDGKIVNVYLSTPDTDVFKREAGAIIAAYRVDKGQDQLPW